MASAPKVETLAQSIANLAPGYDEQRGLISEQLEGLSGMYSSKVAGLEATKDRAFEQINNQATGRGMSFSGIPLDEQASYLSTQYLPGLLDLEKAESRERMDLRSQMAQLNTQQNMAAMSRIDQQQSALNQWNLAQMQREAQARENELQRQFQASQAQLDRNFTASQNAAKMAAGGGGGGGPTVRQDFANRLSSLANVKGGYVSSTNYKALRSEFVSGGYGTADNFRELFSNFVEPGQWKTYL